MRKCFFDIQWDACNDLARTLFMKTSGIDREGSKFERMKKDAAHIRQMLKNRITPRGQYICFDMDGKPLGKKHSFPDDLGIVIENVGLWPEYTGMENLALLAKIRGKIGKQEMEEALKRVGLSPSDSRIYKKYSLGMKQRLAIAQAIMERPKLLLLDEPTNALDENGVALIHDLIFRERKRGATIVLASHNRADIDLLCDSVYFLEEGKVVRREDKYV